MHEQASPCRAAAAYLVVFTVALTLGSCDVVKLAAPPTPTVAASATAVPAQVLSSISLTTGVRSVAEHVTPAVVQITNEQVQLDQLGQAVEVPAGVGTGVTFDGDGHILTNAHVVEGAKKLRVTMTDGRSFPAVLVGSDPQTDVAVVQVQGQRLPMAELDPEGAVAVGDWVVAIGNALALPGGPTVTAGVVGATGRTVQEPNENGGPGPFLFDLIQTDAAINPGNSGGPLLRLDGRVVGINTLTAGTTPNGIPAQGIGFAISLATAMPIAQQLIKTGKADHAYLGIQYVPLTPTLKAQLHTAADHGAVVAAVVPGSPAATAGIERGDVITAIDGAKIEQESDLARTISRHAPGDRITVTIDRSGSARTVTVALAAQR